MNIIENFIDKNVESKNIEEFKKFIKYSKIFHENFDEPLTLEEYASTCGTEATNIVLEQYLNSFNAIEQIKK